MIAEVLKEISVLLETVLEPGELERVKLGVGWISGFGHDTKAIWRRRQIPSSPDQHVAASSPPNPSPSSRPTSPGSFSRLDAGRRIPTLV